MLEFGRIARAVVVVLGGFVSSAARAERLAVLEVSGDALKSQERLLVTDALRGAAVDALGGKVKVMTRENMEVMLSDMGIRPECVSEGACEVETARNLGVDYVVTGSASGVGGVIILSLKLHETKGGELLGSKQARAQDALGTIDAAGPLAGELLGVLASRLGATPPPAMQAAGQPLPQAFQGLQSAGAHTSDSLGALACISPGSFVAGSPVGAGGRGGDERQHPVTLTRGFCVMDHEVSVAEWAAHADRARPLRRKTDPTTPVEAVSWESAIRFANAVSEAEGLTAAYTLASGKVTWDPNANGYRLPTEAEWEAAARGRADTAYPGSDDASEVAWVASRGDTGPHPACGLERNAYGLCDMGGNVAEWVWDAYGVPSADAQIDPSGPAKGMGRVLRGGSWRSVDRREARVAFRFVGSESMEVAGVGFRLARNAPTAQ